MAIKFLTALAQHGPLAKSRLRTVTGYAASGPVSKAFGELVEKRWVETRGDELAITNTGLRVLGPYERLPHGDALRAHLLGPSSKLSVMERRLLEVASSYWPQAVAKSVVREKANYAASGPVSAAFSKLVAMKYLNDVGRNDVVVSGDLFS